MSLISARDWRLPTPSLETFDCLLWEMDGYESDPAKDKGPWSSSGPTPCSAPYVLLSLSLSFSR